MKTQSIYRLNWALLANLLIIVALFGCAGPGTAPALPPEASATPQNSPASESPQPPQATLPSSEVPGPTPTSPPAGTAIRYQDDFTNPGTEWAEATVGDYHVGYHEPEWYEIEVKNPNSEAPIVPVPGGERFGDATIELEVSTFSTKTAAEGDFRYGLVFRRNGGLWYGFIISQPTKQWFVIKNTATGLEILQEGVEESIHERDVNDLLRVDAQGSNFLFHINDRLVEQITDADYPEGEIGFYVKSIDSAQAHIHFDKLTVAELDVSFTCTIKEGWSVNVRSGPGTTYSSFAVLESGDTVQAHGKSSNQWVQVVVEGSDVPGWVSYSDGYMSCTPSIDVFPILSP